MKQHARLESKVEWSLGIWYGGTKETRATTKGKKNEVLSRWEQKWREGSFLLHNSSGHCDKSSYEGPKLGDPCRRYSTQNNS